jgi:putative DNA primase/helicase
VLRFHPGLEYFYEQEHRLPTVHPALLAAVQSPDDDRMISFHRVYLTSDGRKANVPKPKKFWPCTTVVDGVTTATTMNGAACRLDKPTDELVVVEGVETGMGARLTSGLPVWAALSSNGVASLVIPGSVRMVVIAADRDADGKGLKAAEVLAQRLLREDRTRTVKVIAPTTTGRDWADGLKGA